MPVKLKVVLSFISFALKFIVELCQSNAIFWLILAHYKVHQNSHSSYKQCIKMYENTSLIPTIAS